MSDAAFHALALLVSIGAMLLFALSIEAHWRQLAGKRRRPSTLRTGLRLAGTALLGVSFMLCAAADPPTMAMLVWPMLLTLAAALVAAALTIQAGPSVRPIDKR